MALELKGIRILDFSQYIPGPYASSRLAAYGAEVVKVEPPEGDLMRVEADASEVSSAVSYAFAAYNRCKKSIAINLKNPAGRELVLELARHADVIIESFRPGVMARLGLEYQRVREVNERIIYCSLSGYGQEGALSHLGSHDLNYMSLSGLLSQFSHASGASVHPKVTLADLIGGLGASQRILAALMRRAITGEGQYVDVSILGEIHALLEGEQEIAEGTGAEQGIPLLAGDLLCYRIYETKDGRYVSLAALESKFWQNFCRAAGREDWLPAQFTKAIPENPVFAQIKDWFAERTMQEWAQFGMEVDCCLTPVLGIKESSRQHYMRDKTSHSKDSNSPKQGRMPAYASPPQKGEHTAEILQEWLGKNQEEIRAFRSRGVIL